MEMTVALLIVGGFLAVVVFREMLCWYFKFSEQVRLLKAIEIHLEALEARSRGAEPRLGTSPAAYPATLPKVAPDGRKLTFMERLG